MAGKKGHSGPPGNADAFRHGLAAQGQGRRDVSYVIISGTRWKFSGYGCAISFTAE